ncbi:MAG: dTDP-glucose 4,6-dehydratase, partial [Planctomycetaceae bacterium]
EKLIPLFISNALKDEALPVYGKGNNVRDWIHVLDHCRGIDVALRNGEPGEVYNFGGNSELQNIDLTFKLLDALGKPRTLIRHVEDRAGHDFRYAIDTTRVEHELGWKPQMDFETGLRSTINWYLDNKGWAERIQSGQYRDYYETQYGKRLA